MNNNSIDEEDENEQDPSAVNQTKTRESDSKQPENAKSKDLKTKKKQQTKNKSSSVSFNSQMKLFGLQGVGSGLSQTAKAQIIKDIIRNYDIDMFIDQLRAKDVVQIQLNRKLTFMSFILRL